MFSVTLIANPVKETLSEAALDSIALRLDAQEIRWLEKGVACALVIPSKAEASLRSLAGLGMTYDFIIQPHPRPRYKLFVADMESTIIENECLDELADYVGLRDKIETITRRAMNGELDFKAALEERVNLLAGLPESALQEVYNRRVCLMSGAEVLMKTLKDRGIYTMLVSGGFSFYAELIKQRLGFDEQRSNRLEIAAGKLTGNVLPPILDKHAKLAALNEGCAKLGIAPDEVIAIGDGANDLPMLLAAGLGIAYHAKPNVRAEAKNQLNHCDLSALTYVI